MHTKLKPMKPLEHNKILIGDVRTKLATISTDSIDAVITSPPYFRLRDYQEKEQIGLESHIKDWVAELEAVFDDIARVLKPSGSLWLNLGDSYSRHVEAGAVPKSLLLAPERLLLALSARGWIVRNKVIWAKTNPMPASVKDRLTSTHEYVYFLTRSPKYNFDLDSIRVAPKTAKGGEPKSKGGKVAEYPPSAQSPPSWQGPLAGNNMGLAALRADGRSSHPLGKNPGDVWHLATASYHDAHFATFPRALVERPLLAACPERLCSRCDQPWRATTSRALGHLAVAGELLPNCDCNAPWNPGLVLDPFFGAGTVGLVAQEHGRAWIGIELNPDFAALAEKRIRSAHPNSTVEMAA